MELGVSASLELGHTDTRKSQNPSNEWVCPSDSEPELLGVFICLVAMLYHLTPGGHSRHFQGKQQEIKIYMDD